MPKKATSYMSNFGRPVAFYSELTRVTGSTNATLLLCQLIYWSDKTKAKDGWVWKNSSELEEETGLTYYEQRNARKKLVALGILEEQRKRADYVIRFKVDTNKLNELWNEYYPYNKKAEEIAKQETEEEIMENNKEIEYIYVGDDTRYHIVPETKNSLHPSYLIETLDDSGSVIRTRTSAVPPVKDPLAKFFELQALSENAQKARDMEKIKIKFEEKFHINASTRRWETFIEYCWKREKKFGEPVDVFITWALNNGFNPVYWSPVKMKELYPNAFSAHKANPDFYEPLPVIKKKKVVPLPEDFGRKKSLQ